MERPKPEELPEEVLDALGIKQSDVGIVTHEADGRLKIITNNARKLYYPPAEPPIIYPPIHTIDVIESRPDILTTLQEHANASAERIAARRAKKRAGAKKE